MGSSSNFLTSLSVSDLYFFVLTLSVFPTLIAMILRMFCFHKEAIVISRITLIMSGVSLVLKVAMIKPTMPYFSSLVLNVLALCAVGIAFGLNGDKKILEHDIWGKRLINIFLSLLYVALAIVLLTSF